MLKLVAGLVVLSVAIASASAGAVSTGNSASSPVGRTFVPVRGLWAEFEDPRRPGGWFSGQLIEEIAAPSVRQEVSRQLGQMRLMGVNEIAFEIRSGDGDTPVGFPRCRLSTWLGPLWPQPTATQLTGLQTVFDLAEQHGIRVMLILDSTHMEEQPPTNAGRWLSAILGAIKDKQALDLVAFGGDRHLVDANPPFDGVPDSCGGQAEAPLWLGPNSVEAGFVQWAIGYAMSLGVPPQKLTAEAIVGYYGHEAQQPAGPTADDRHLWRPLEVMRTIFDRLGVPAEQRVYAASAYLHAKCAFYSGSCSDSDQFSWWNETMRVSRSRVGPTARLTLTEWGTDRNEPAVAPAVEHMGVLMQQLGIEGGAYYKWADSAADIPEYAYPVQTLVKVRGATSFQPVQRELADLYGFHLTAIPNGSFEEGLSGWSRSGSGSATPVGFAQGEVPLWRGMTALRLEARQLVSVTSGLLRVSARTAYTVTGNFQVGPRSFASFRFFTCRKRRSLVRPELTRALQPTQSFETLALSLTTPRDACFVRIVVGTRSTLVVDQLR